MSIAPALAMRPFWAAHVGPTRVGSLAAFPRFGLDFARISSAACRRLRAGLVEPMTWCFPAVRPIAVTPAFTFTSGAISSWAFASGRLASTRAEVVAPRPTPTFVGSLRDGSIRDEPIGISIASNVVPAGFVAPLFRAAVLMPPRLVAPVLFPPGLFPPVFFPPVLFPLGLVAARLVASLFFPTAFRSRVLGPRQVVGPRIAWRVLAFRARQLLAEGVAPWFPARGVLARGFYRPFRLGCKRQVLGRGLTAAARP